MTIEERITEVLAEHQATSKLLSPSDLRTACLCGAYAQDDEIPTYGNTWTIAHQASVLAELFREAEKEGEGMEKEYATLSPNARAHGKLQIMNHGDEADDIGLAQTFANIYLEQSVDGGIHGDAEAAGVWRWVGEWEYMDGYPKTREQVVQMIEDKKKEDKA